MDGSTNRSVVGETRNGWGVPCKLHDGPTTTSAQNSLYKKNSPVPPSHIRRIKSTTIPQDDREHGFHSAQQDSSF